MIILIIIEIEEGKEREEKVGMGVRWRGAGCCGVKHRRIHFYLLFYQSFMI